MTVVAVSGATGRMGRLASAVIDAASDLTLGPLYAPSSETTVDGRPVTADRASLGEADVVVEFCPPDAVMDNLAAWRDLGLHSVVGTSGFDDQRIEELAMTWVGTAGRCLVVPNFAIGAVLMMRFAELAAPHFAASEIIELHHDRKVDAPSGTALATAERIAAAKPNQHRASESAEAVERATGADVAGVRVHSLRLPGLLAHQEVIFGGEGETLTIRHDTTDRSAFGPGIVVACRGVAGLPEPLTVGLEALISL